MKRGEKVYSLAARIVKELGPFCSRVEVAGSIRRKKKNPGDVDIVLIPKSEKAKQNIKKKLSKQGRFLQGGDKEMFFKIEGIDVDLFFTTSEEWGATLLAYSGNKGPNIGLRIVARKKGMKLTNHGLFRLKDGKRLAGNTEKEIYSVLGRPYKEPWNR